MPETHDDTQTARAPERAWKPGEYEATRGAIDAGSLYGFWNIIDRLKAAWAATQLHQDRDLKLTPRDALRAALFTEPDVEAWAKQFPDREALMEGLQAYSGMYWP